jgi:glycosyltransferase involved in cell wall biosynthesis
VLGCEVFVVKPRILVVGPGVRPTGYARVIESMLRPIRDHYDFSQFAINYSGPPMFRYWPIFPNTIRGDPFGLTQLPAIISTIDPQLLLFVFDIHLYYFHQSQLERRHPSLPVVLYCPIDGDDADFAFLRGLKGLARLVLFTRFARTVVEGAARRAEAAEALPGISVIPHGNDPTIFRPCLGAGAWPDIIESRRIARRRLFPSSADLDAAFIVLNANQNNPRKRIDLTLEAFALFARDKPPDVRLYLHTDLYERGCELRPIARRLGIEERLLVTAEKRQFASTSDETLNLIYNACDVGVNTSIGEGWGLVAFEHGATGACQVLPRNSVHEELWEGAADLVDVGRTIRNRFDFVTHHSVSPDGVAVALERLYRNPELLRFRSLEALHRAISPDLSWTRVAKDWFQLFDDIIGTSRDHSTT